MATTGLTHELRRVDWDAAEWHASLLCLPAIAIALIGALVVSMYLAYALQNVNYALYAVPLTAYIVFILAVARTPEASTAEHRVIATAIAGVVAMLIHALYVREELQRTLMPMPRVS